MSLDVSRLVFAGTVSVNASYFPNSFRHAFFSVLHWPIKEPIQPTIDEGELTEGEWITAIEALRKWSDEDVLAAPPTLYFLEVLSQNPPLEAPRLFVQHGCEKVHPAKRFLETRPGVIAIPLLAPHCPLVKPFRISLAKKRWCWLMSVLPSPSEIDRLVSLLRYLEEGFRAENLKGFG